MAIGTLGAALIGGGLLGSALIGSNASNSAGRQVSQATDRAADLQNQQFNRMLQLAMPGYNRAEGAAGIYGQALGLPQMGASGYGGQPQGGSNVPGTQPGLMTGVAGGGLAARYGMDRELGPQVLPDQPGQPQATQANPQLSIADQVMNTPGYQTQLDQGLKAIDRAAPLVGGMYSGRRMKALEAHGQNTFGGFYNDWMNRVGGIAGQSPQIAQSVGQAGMQNASNVGNLMMTGANARANATMNGASAWTGAIGTGLGMVGGARGWF